MTRRKRRRQGNMAEGDVGRPGKLPTVEGFPREELNDLLKSIGDVSLRISRRNAKGHLAYVDRRMMSIKEMLETWEDFVKRQYGGGDYLVDVYAPEDNVTPKLRFKQYFEGMSRPINRDANQATVQGFTSHGTALVNTTQGTVEVSAAQAMAIMGQSAPQLPQFQVPQMQQSQMPMQMQPTFMPPPPPTPVVLTPQQSEESTNTGYNQTQVEAAPGAPVMSQSPFSQGVNPFLLAAQGLYPQPQQQQGMQQIPGPRFASDEAFQEQVKLLRAEMDRDRAEAAARSAKAEEQMKAKDEEIRRLREDAERRERQQAEERHKLEMESLKREIALANQRPQTTDWASVAPVLSAIAPVLATMVGSGRDASKAALEAQTQMSMNMMQILGQKQPDGMSEMLKTLGPVLAPVLIKMIDQRSPEAQAALMSTMADTSMQNIAMMSQMIDQVSRSQDGAAPWYLPMIENGIKGLMETFAAFSSANQPKQQMFAPPPQRLPQPQVQAHPPQQQMAHAGQAPQQAPSVYATLDAAGESVPTNGAGKHEAPTNGGGGNGGPSPELMTRMVMSRMPQEYKRPEWEKIVYALHAQQDPAFVSQLIIRLIDHMLSFEMLPDGLHTVLESPRETLGAIIQQLPIFGIAQEYCVKVVDMAAEEISKWEVEAKPDADEGEPEDGVIVPPVPVEA